MTVYKLVTSIDIGSTNSQMAQCYQESEDGDCWKISITFDHDAGYLRQMNDRYDIPSIIVAKKDLSENLQRTLGFGDNDFLVGGEAEQAFYSHQGVSARMEFKRDFFCSGEELVDQENRKKFEEACESIEYLLRFFKKMADDAEKYHADKEVMEETVITVPIRATANERDKMRELAEKVGWKNVEIRDEARAVLRYALGTSESFLHKSLENMTIHEKIFVLIVDIGGSTSDILLVEINPDGKGNIDTNILGQWPEIGEKQTLGGIDIDKKLCEWFLEKEYLVPELVDGAIQRYGYIEFRKFKEHSTSALNGNNEVSSLFGNIGYLEYDRYRRIQSKRAYPQDGVINPTVFLDKIMKEYLNLLQDAIRKLLKNCDFHEEDIDCLVASGGGARMYGISKLLKGESLPGIDKPFRFKKIQTNPKMFIENWDVSSAMCALGSAWPLEHVSFRNSCPCDCLLRFDVYRTNSSNVDSNWDTATFYAPPTIPSCFKQTRVSEEYIFAHKNEALPIKISKTYSQVPLYVEDGDVFVYVISAWSISDENVVHFQKAWADYSRRTPWEYFSQIGKAIVNKVTSLFDTDGIIQADFSIKTEINENFMIKIRPSVKIEGQWCLLDHDRTTNA